MSVMRLKRNIRWWDRTVRFFLGCSLIAWAIAGGPLWAYLGVYILASGAWGYCALYSLVGYQPFEREI